jgi:hemoglobin
MIAGNCPYDQNKTLKYIHTMTYTKLSTLLLTLPLLLATGCGSGGQKENKDFFTSGNREADQRADQRMVKAQQLKGEGSGKGGDKDPKSPEKAPLYERLGGADGITAIVNDWTTRALEDPRVNWARNGVTRGGFSIHRNKSVAWDASPANVAQLKKHIVQFLSLATGGPAHYDGKDMKQAHNGLHITNAEFDAAVGDLKATLDNLRMPNQEQKELLSIVESTRPQIAESR